MKRTILYTAAILASAAFYGCNDEVYTPIENGVYLSEAAPGNTHNQQTESLQVDDEDVVKTLTARLAKAVDEDITVSFELDESLIEEYNEANGTSYQLLPEEYRTFETSAVISAGRTTATPVELTVSPYTTPNAETYAIGIRMKVTSGSLETVGNADHMLYLLTSPNKQKSIILKSGAVSTDFPAEISAEQWTIEFWLRVDNPYQGQSGFTVTDAASWEGESNIWMRRYIFLDNASPIQFNDILLRFWADGASKIAPTLQCQFDGGYFDSNEWWYPDTWYHIAYTYDGSKVTLYKDGVEDKNLDFVKSFAFSNVTLCSNCSYHGYPMTNEFAQIRLWSKCLTASTIQDGMSRSIAVDSEGLIAYWKCDEGEGVILHDSGPYGIDIDLSANSAPTWSETTWNFSHPNE